MTAMNKKNCESRKQTRSFQVYIRYLTP